jgi:ABC-type phosphate/phosphonate transport system substrate-binding protein
MLLFTNHLRIIQYIFVLLIDSKSYFSLFSERVKDFIDLRGCKWAYNPPQSMSGHVITLNQLKELGENTSFFGNIMPSSSHLQSIHMVLNKQTDATAVDSNCLQIFLDRNPSFKDDISVLTSWGPLPPYPIVVNKNMPQFLREQITDALLQMHRDKDAVGKLAKYRITKFAQISQQEYLANNDLFKKANQINFGVRYY